MSSHAPVIAIVTLTTKNCGPGLLLRAVSILNCQTSGTAVAGQPASSTQVQLCGESAARSEAYAMLSYLLGLSARTTTSGLDPETLTLNRTVARAAAGTVSTKEAALTPANENGIAGSMSVVAKTTPCWKGSGCLHGTLPVHPEYKS
jgi:hypothetical protein